ncbi:MAG: thrombospondin type 3 repeat-containing protein, partial [Myxococcales bacterium]|nr:thrombospondin type 3 repeat-containing protein [Myxococcales bacterium]
EAVMNGGLGGDGVGDACDNCPDEPNFRQTDGDGDGIGDACESPDDDDADGVPDADDNCPSRANPDQGDGDDDGVGDACDNCPQIPNFSQADDDHDGVGNACEPTDTDGDGTPDALDNCPERANPDQRDMDRDGRGDMCDPCPNFAHERDVDADRDGVLDDCDNCAAPNPDQADADGDGIGDACEAADLDGDGVADGRDNCPHLANADQRDSDRDGRGDACDPCPQVANEDPADSDGDGIPDACDMPVGDPTGLRVVLTWRGDNANAELHLLHPRGQWYDVTWDLYSLNQNPGWGAPGMAAESQRAGTPEEIIAEALPPGVYHVGVAYAGVDDQQPAGPIDATVNIECGGNPAQRFGPEHLDAPVALDLADLWQVARITLPECRIELLPAEQRIATTLCAPFGACAVCNRCANGPCFNVDCEFGGCDLRTGACPDPCAGVRCAAGQICNPRDQRCYPTGQGLCDPCTFAGQCTAEGTTACLTLNNEAFCSRGCGIDADCPPNYDCLGLEDNPDDRYCAPERRTCIDRCAGVRCGAPLVCDPLTGMCVDPPCQTGADCPANNYCGHADGACHAMGTGAGAPGANCQATADCQRGSICTAFGICAQICNDNGPCPAGSFCLPDLFDNNRDVCFAPPG